MVQAIAEPDRLEEDPCPEVEWAPQWRPAPCARVAPVEVEGLPWAMEWTTFAFEDAYPHIEELYNPYEQPPEVVVRGGAVAVETGGSTLKIRARSAELFADYYDSWDWDDVLRAFLGLTGWAAYDPHAGRLALEPLVCGGCGQDYETSLEGEPAACPRCGADDPRARAPAPPPPVDPAAGRLVGALVDAGWLELDGDPGPAREAFAAALAGPSGAPHERGRRLAEALLSAAGVGVVYLTAAPLGGLLAAW